MCVCVCKELSLVSIKYSDDYKTSQSIKVEQTIATFFVSLYGMLGFLTCNCTYTCVCVCNLWVYIVR